MSRKLPVRGCLFRTFMLSVAACDSDLIHSSVGCRGQRSAFFLFFFRLALAAAWLPMLSDQALQQGALAGIGSAKHKTLHQHALSVLSCLLLCVVWTIILPVFAAPNEIRLHQRTRSVLSCLLLCVTWTTMLPVDTPSAGNTCACAVARLLAMCVDIFNSEASLPLQINTKSTMATCASNKPRMWRPS